MLDLDIVALIKDRVHRGRTEYLEKPSTICDLARARGFYVAAEDKPDPGGEGGDRLGRRQGPRSQGYRHAA